MKNISMEYHVSVDNGELGPDTVILSDRNCMKACINLVDYSSRSRSSNIAYGEPESEILKFKFNKTILLLNDGLIEKIWKNVPDSCRSISLNIVISRPAAKAAYQEITMKRE